MERKSELTPSNDAELEDVSAYVGVEDLDQSDVHVNGLQAHPGEGGQQKVVQKDSRRRAQPLVFDHGGKPPVQQEDNVEEQQRRAEVHQDLRWIISSQLPVRMEKLTFSRFISYNASP